jgi:hypothetical protein
MTIEPPFNCDIFRCNQPADWAIIGESGDVYLCAEHYETQTSPRICDTCPVLAPCRAWALTTPDPAISMIAGAMTPSQRAAVRAGGVAIRHKPGRPRKRTA